MRHGDFSIGMEFMTDTGRWRCTDIGTRTITAIQVSVVNVTRLSENGDITRGVESSDPSWFNGPPYAVAKQVFDENDIPACWIP